MATQTERFLNYNGILHAFTKIIKWVKGVLPSITEKNTSATADANDKYIKVTKSTSGGKDTYTVTTTGIDALAGSIDTINSTLPAIVADVNSSVGSILGETGGNRTAKYLLNSDTGSGSSFHTFPYYDTVPFIVTVTDSGSTRSADKSFADVVSALNAGKTVIYEYSGKRYYVAAHNNAYVEAVCTDNADGVVIATITHNASSVVVNFMDLDEEYAHSSELSGYLPTSTTINGTSKDPSNDAYTIKAGDINLTSAINAGEYTTSDSIQVVLDSINTKVNTATSSGLTRSIVTALPTSDISTTTIYMILASDDPNVGDPSSGTSQNANAYNEYMYINNEWERIGSTEVNLDIDALTTSDIDTCWTTALAAA